MRRAWVIFIFIYGVASSQDLDDPTVDIERIIEEIFQLQDQDVNYEELYEALLLYLSSPINLNTAEEDDLRSLYILSNSQIRQLLNYRTTYGKFLSIFELQAVPELDRATILRLLPFVEVDPRTSERGWKGLFKRIGNEENAYLLLRYERTLEEKRGFTEADNESTSRYAGSPDKLYSRFRISHNKDFSAGFTMEKDAGEQLRFDSDTRQYGGDYYGYYFQVMDKGKLANLVLGDYQIQRGQGLVFGSGFNIGKGAETIITTRRANIGIRPYTSVVETGYFRGLATTWQLTDNWSITPMYSNLNQDAVLREDATFNKTSFRTIQTSGLHRTASEIASRNTVREINYGMNVNYKKGRLAAGVNVLNTQFAHPLIPESTIENQADFTGDHNYVYSLYADYGINNYSIFAEVSQSKSGGIGALLGLISNLSRKVETSILIRNYDKNFHSFYGLAFGESSQNINEQGIYWGIKYLHSQKLTLTAYFDAFRYPGLRSFVSRPSSGHEYLARLSYRPSKKSIFYVQAAQQSAADNISSQDLEGQLQNAAQSKRNRYLINYDYQISKAVGIKSRIQWSNQHFNGNRTDGFAMVQDLNLSHRRWHLSSMIGLFDTDDFDNRQYIYERDVLYAFSIPALSGRGLRSYFVLRFKASRKLDFWIKYSRTRFTDRETVGSGLEEIDGNSRTIVRAQTRIRF